MFLFKPTKKEEPKKVEDSRVNQDLELVMKLNQEFASSLDLNDTLNTALKQIVSRLNAQAANVFLINEKIKKFECIASLHQDYLEDYQLDLKGGLAIVMGAEGSGLRRLTAENCDQLFAIPMSGAIESLNVSVATGVCLFEASRQRLGL